MKAIKTILSIIPHFSIISAGTLIALYIIEYYNGSLSLLNTNFAHVLIITLIITSVLSFIILFTKIRNK